MSSSYRIGIDVGGTFTDAVCVDEGGSVTLAKAASTPADPSIGVLDAIQALAERLAVDSRALLAATWQIVHGTTVATNALLERRGARVGLLTTQGHRDVLEMREGLKPERYNLRMPPPAPLVPRALRLGVRERVLADGRAAVPLSRASLDRAVGALTRAGADAVAVCFLHAYRNPAHELAARDAVRRRLPRAYVSLAWDVLPQIKEYERVCTTVINAYVGPVLDRYLTRLASRLRAAGFRRHVLVMQSHGGVAAISEATRLAAGAILSGPAGGIAGGQYAARLLGQGNLITFDMGGTSTDIALFEDGRPRVAADRRVSGHTLALPSLDIHTIGAGGGSLARVDAGGILHVGPESAGAEPGPACYGRGGTRPTVTDANVVLGYLDPDTFWGGRRRLDAEAARRAVDTLTKRLGGSAVDAARGIHEVINTAMAEGIRVVSVRRGIDPRRFALLAFGGAAGLHATAVAGMLGIGRVVMPRHAPVLSAWGMLAADLRYNVVRTHVGDVRKVGAPRLRRLFAEMERDGRRRLEPALAASAGAPDGGPQDGVRGAAAGALGAVPGRNGEGAGLHLDVVRSLDLRYGEQIFEIDVPLDGIALEDAGLIERILERFHKRHEELYTYSAPDQEVVLVNARLAVIGRLASLPVEPALEPSAAPIRASRPAGGSSLSDPDAAARTASGARRPPRDAPAPATRRVYLQGWREVPVHAWHGLAPGAQIDGPAIVESEATTVLLRPRERAAVTPHGWLDVDVGVSLA
ncbi:MAG TPA: hydantoinase/oxoprolinase family protein [bacterium]|nr:hydantoinase/oxoprolinase family protein [bacterium]